VAQDDEITDVFNKIFEDLKTVGSVPSMLHGLRDLIAELNDQCRSVPSEVNQVLSDFFTLRTGMRFLLQHHMESRRGRKFGYSGILQLSCNPAKVATSAARDSSKLCRATLGQVPDIIVKGDVSETLTYVPPVLQYILTEVFKNSCRAVVERHGYSGFDDDLPPVLCEIEGSRDGLTIRIRDEGNGMSKEQLARVWDFMYTTYKSSKAWKGCESTGQGQSGVLAGYGVGLPLSRMYARYFGGDVTVSSKEGHGTEICIKLCRSPVCGEVLPSDFWLGLAYLDSPPNFHDTSYSLNVNSPVA
jgi:pyruvate dehydrogenase kinase 2/3/4